MTDVILIVMFVLVGLMFSVLFVLFVKDIIYELRGGSFCGALIYFIFEVFCVMIICLSICGIISAIKGV